MLDSLWLCVILGTVLGFLSGLGVGGGSLLMLWLTVVLNYPQDTARQINLLFFLPCSLIACIFRRYQGYLNLRKAYPAIIAGCVSACIFSSIGSNLDTSLLKKLFGALLLYTGIRELFYKQKPKRP